MRICSKLAPLLLVGVVYSGPDRRSESRRSSPLAAAAPDSRSRLVCVLIALGKPTRPAATTKHLAPLLPSKGNAPLATRESTIQLLYTTGGYASTA